MSATRLIRPPSNSRTRLIEAARAVLLVTMAPLVTSNTIAILLLVIYAESKRSSMRVALRKRYK